MASKSQESGVEQEEKNCLYQITMKVFDNHPAEITFEYSVDPPSGAVITRAQRDLRTEYLRQRNEEAYRGHKMFIQKKL